MIHFSHCVYSKSPRQSRRSGLTIIEFLVVLAIIAGLVALLLPSVRTARGPARRSQCKNNLKQIGIALHIYHDTYQALPPAFTVDERGNRLHSWRTLILPFLEQQALYETIDLSKPWSDPANAQAREAALSVYLCPSIDGPPTHTPYQGIVGEENAFDSERSRVFEDFKDGTSNTVMIVETLPEDAVHWMSPNDVDEEYFLSLNEDSETAHSGGGNILLVDGSVRFLSSNSPADIREALMTIAAGDELGDW